VFAAICSFLAAKHLAAKKIKVDFRQALFWLLLSGLGQIGDVIITYLLAGYFLQDVSFLNLLVVMPLVYVATILPISLGGIGVREGVMAGLLAFLGVNISIAILIALTLFLSKVFVGFIGALLYYRSDKSPLKDMNKNNQGG